MELTDSHIHLQDYKTIDINNVIKKAKLNGVTRFVNVSSHPSDWSAIDKLAETYPHIIPAYGIHPWYIQHTPQDWLHRLETRLQSNAQAWIGECGIDYLKNKNIEEQLSYLLPQIELAKRYHRPLIIHEVKANEPMQKLFLTLPSKTIFHSFTGSAEWGKQIQGHGFFIGLNFSILRKKNIIAILQNLNINQILLETDGPYQNIEQTETMPENLPLLAAKIAPIFNLTTTDFQNIIARNWSKFIGENNE